MLNNVKKALKGLQLKRLVNKLLRILYFEFLDLKKRAKEKKDETDKEKDKI